MKSRIHPTLIITYLFFLIILCLISLSYSQTPGLTSTSEREKVDKKNEFYQKLMLSELQITENQEDYDVKYYSLDLTPNPETSILTGTAEVTIEVVAATLDHVELNFWNGMNITDVHRADNPGLQLNYNNSNDILSVNLASTYSQGEQFNLVIAYNGSPQNSGYGSFMFGMRDGKHAIGTFNEPYGARAWWPCKDVPSDKADSIDIRITVPNELIVASNGTLRETNIEGDMTTYWWHESYPISTYLVSLAIYPYFVWYDEYISAGGERMPIEFYTFSDTAVATPSYLVTNYKKTTEMLEFFAGIFGEYPFLDEKYGHAEWTLSFGMEHQTLTSMGDPTERRVAHELAHQWWGDLITCDSFHHIWLNEGFARYAESLWFAHTNYSPSASHYQMDRHLYMGSGTIFVEDPHNQDILNIGLSYNKASWVLHMLRHAVGDSVFYEILQSYGTSPLHQYGTATTEEFQAICQQVSGIDFLKFFQQWIYEEYYPKYSYGWSLKPLVNGYSMKLRIDQIQQNTGIFWMPIDIKVTSDTIDSVYVVWDSLQSQTFSLFVPEEPVNIDLDPDNWILKEIENRMLLPYPHAQNVTVKDPYRNPGIDTLFFTSESANPDNHNLVLTAIIESSAQVISDNIPMFDDGLHHDSAAGDGLFGGSWPVPSGERDYNINIKTLSSDSGYYNILRNAAQFTTTGPVTINRYSFLSQDTIPNYGDRIDMQLFLRNEGSVSVVENLAVTLSTDNPSIVIYNPKTISVGDIPAGEIASTNGAFTFEVVNDSSINWATKFDVAITSDGDLFWKDSLFVDIFTGLEKADQVIPKVFSLDQNYPNPFNPSTTISFALPKPEQVRLVVYNLLGEKVETLLDKSMLAGHYDISYQANNLPSGIYFYRIEAGKFKQVRKMILLR